MKRQIKNMEWEKCVCGLRVYKTRRETHNHSKEWLKAVKEAKQ